MQSCNENMFSSLSQCKKFMRSPPFRRYYIINSLLFQVKYSACAECEIISLRKLWNISRRLRLWSMWNKIRSFTRRRRISLPQAISHASAYFTRSVRNEFHWKKPIAFAIGFFLGRGGQFRTVCLIFLKSIHGFRSADRLIPWRWWELHPAAVFRGAAPCLQTNLCII